MARARPLVSFGVISAAMIGGAGLCLAALFGANACRAIAVSTLVAYVVQIGGYAILRRLARRNLLVAWGSGAGLRFVALAAYALLGVRAWKLDPTAALLSLVTFFFVSTLAEPWLLRS